MCLHAPVPLRPQLSCCELRRHCSLSLACSLGFVSCAFAEMRISSALAALVLLVGMMCCAAILPAVHASAAESSAAESSAVAVAAPASRVRVAVYVEAYCPRCIDVLTNSLSAALRKVGSIVDLDVIPFGNGQEKGGVISCQHGARECQANTIQACAQEIYPTQSQWFAFIVCMEKQRDPVKAGAVCARAHAMNYQRIAACAAGPQGAALLMKNARRTLDLQPTNLYVPWLTVNSQPFEDPENIVAAICSQYTGLDKLRWCNQATMARYVPGQK